MIQQALETHFADAIGQRTKDILIDQLRYYFSNISLFGNPSNPIKMPMVKETYALDMREYPCVLVNISHSSKINCSIGQDYCEDVFSDDQQVGQIYLPGTENFTTPVPYKPRAIAERYVICADIGFNLKVIGSSTVIRNRVAGETQAACARHRRQALLDNGIQILKCDEGPEGELQINGTEKLFIANISLVVNAESYFDYPVSYITAVNGTVGYGEIPSNNNGYVIQPGDWIP